MHRNNKKYVPHKQENVYVKKVTTIEDSDESGFTGNPTNWFNDEEYYKSFNLAFGDGENKDYYFNSYSHFHIHEEMLKDRIRTDSYRNAILNNKDSFKDKVVLDIGCGTGVLSIFAARAGAKKVYGIEFADIADFAKEIVKRNNLSDKITIIKSKVEDANVPEKVDIIISEWMGYMLLYESMLDCVLFARDKWLNPGGIILPDRATINIASIEDSSYKRDKIEFWNDIYGIDMGCIRQAAIQEPIVDFCEKEAINSSICRVFEIDLYTCTVKDLDFANKYELVINRNDTVHALVAWFDIAFDKLPNKVFFTTGPYKKTTHWKQTVFYTENDIKVYRGDVIKGSIALRKSKANFRELDIKISYHYEGRHSKQDFTQLYKLR